MHFLAKAFDGQASNNNSQGGCSKVDSGRICKCLGVCGSISFCLGFAMIKVCRWGTVSIAEKSLCKMNCNCKLIFLMSTEDSKLYFCNHNITCCRQSAWLIVTISSMVCVSMSL